MEKLQKPSDITNEDLTSFFDGEDITQIDFVLAASHSRMPRAMVSRHVYIAAMSETRLIMWAKRRTLAKSLSEISCSILLEDLKIQDTWSKKNKKSCELLFPDGQQVIIESIEAGDTFVENIAKKVMGDTNYSSSNTAEHPILETDDDVFISDGVAQTPANSTAFAAAIGAKAPGAPKVRPDLEPSAKARAEKKSKEVVVTREVIIQSLSRAMDGSISLDALQQWAHKVRDFKVIDADEAMVSYILFSLSRIDPSDPSSAKKAIEEYSERLNISLV